MLRGVASGGGSAAAGITIGTSIITGGTNTRVLFDDSGVVGESSGLTYVKGSGTLTGTALVGGNITDSALTAGRVTFAGTAGLLGDNANLLFSATGSVSGGPLLTIGSGAGASSGWTMGYTNALGLSTGSTLHITGVTASTTNYTLYSDPTYTILNAPSQVRFGVASQIVGSATVAGLGIHNSNSSPSIVMSSANGTANSIVYSAAGGTASIPVTSRTEINKSVTAIADNAATATFTVTIPNGAHSAGINFVLTGSAGAGGAIGANEFSALIAYDCVVTRTTGVNAVATLSAALLTAITASVAGGATPTISAAISAIAGAVGAANTFTLNVTIHALTGSSTNHTCFCYASLMNANASGVSIA